MDDELARRSTDLIIRLQNECEIRRIEGMELRRSLDYACKKDPKMYDAAIRAGKAQLKREFPNMKG